MLGVREELVIRELCRAADISRRPTWVCRSAVGLPSGDLTDVQVARNVVRSEAQIAGSLPAFFLTGKYCALDYMWSCKLCRDMR